MADAIATIAAIIAGAPLAPTPEEVMAEIAAAADANSAAKPRKESKSRSAAARPIEPSSPAEQLPSPPAAAAAPPAAPALDPFFSSESSQKGGSAGESFERGAAGEPPDDLNLRLAFIPQTDLGNAERFVARQRDKLMFCEAIGWLWWDGKRWARDGAEQYVKRGEHDTVRAIQLESKALRASDRDTVHKLERDGTKVMMSDKLAAWGRQSEGNSKIISIAKNACAYLAVPTSALDADPLSINVANGTIVVRRQWDGDAPTAWRSHGDYIRLKPHDPSDLITKLAPVTFDPAAPRELFDRFMGEVQPQPAMRRFLQAWKGYSLTGDASEQRMAIFHGNGQNGKSVLEDVTSFIAGDYAETVPIETFLASGREANANAPTPARALLHGARMVRTSEPNKGASFDEGFIKLVTGGEPIQARNLNMPMFRFYPMMKLTVSCNPRPKISGTDEGIWRRVTLVPWGVFIPPEKRDRQLTEKLRKEASGILNWMVDGLSDWIENGLVLPDEVKQATAEYRRDSDQLGRFLEVCVALEPDARTQSSVLHAVFNAWAAANGGTQWSNKGLTNAMRERGFKSDKSSVMFWLGIRLTKSEADFPSPGGSSRPREGPAPSYGDRGGVPGDDLVF